MEFVERAWASRAWAAFYSIESIEEVVQDEQRLAHGLGVDAVGGVLWSVDLAAEHDWRGLARPHRDESGGRDAERRGVASAAHRAHEAPHALTRAAHQSIVHLEKGNMVGGATREKVVVLDAVQMRRFFEQIVERIVIPKGDQDAYEVSAHGFTRDVKAPFAY